MRQRVAHSYGQANAAHGQVARLPAPSDPELLRDASYCLAAPLLSMALPLLASEGVELGLFLLLLGFAALVIGSGVRRHGRPWPLLLLIPGIAVLTALHALEGADEGPLGPALVVLGSVLFAAAHLSNRRALREHARCC